MKNLILIIPLFFLTVPGFPTATAQDNDQLSAREIIEKADQKMNGETNTARLKMTIVRPTWKREIEMKSWAKGDELGLILITAPARDKGAAFLKRGKEIWNWQPTIDRIIKLPPSMMMQSWMGSDFTNDDLVKQSSIVDDYEHTLLGKEEIEGRTTYKIELVPHENSAVVWGKVIAWIDTAEYMELKTEFYDEDSYLINTMYGKEIEELGGRLLPSVLEVIPADEEGHKTIVEYLELTFNEPIQDGFFSIQKMKRVR